MDRENSTASSRVGHTDIDQFIEPPRPQQRRVDEGRPVGRADHNDVLQLFKTIHLRKNGVHYPFCNLRLTETAATCRNKAIQLVDEDDCRRDLSCAVEQPGYLLLAFAVPLAEQVRRLSRNEIGFRLAGGRLREQRLAGSWWPIQEE